jgi:hypothetical protein
LLESGKALAKEHCLARLVFELMEPGSLLLDPEATVLQRPENWTDSIKDFLGQAAKLRLSALQKVPFLKAAFQGLN